MSAPATTMSAEEGAEALGALFKGRKLELALVVDRTAASPWFSITVDGCMVQSRWCPALFESLAIHGVRTQHDYLISLHGRIEFELSQPFTVDTCEHGHKFARLKVHPMRDGRPRCPHCMAIGLDNLYAEQVLAGSEFIDVEPLLARLKEHLSDPAFDAGERDYTQSLINRITAKRHLDEERRRLRF